MSEITSQQKAENYREQNKRLRKAMANHFLLEAICIEYNIIEDQTEAILSYAGVFDPEKHNTLAKKITRIKQIAKSQKSILRKYITEEAMEAIKIWSKKRNDCIHILLTTKVSTEELEKIASDGQTHSKMLCTKADLYKKALEQARSKNPNRRNIK